jgi:hypothetical protein
MLGERMSQRVASTLRRRPGRPRKFAAPSRAVTVTLPESVFEMLRTIDADPSRAVARLVERGRPPASRPPAELSVFGRRAVITIRPSSLLERRTGVSLVPLPDGRALIAVDAPTTIDELELMLYDALDDPQLPADDRRVFEEIGAILKDARRSQDVALLRRNIIVIETPRLRTAARPRPRRAKR